MKTRVLSLLASAAALALVTSSASAADLPAQTAPPPPIISVPLFTWTGFYVGVNAGWGWRNGDNETVFLSPGAGTPGLAGTLNFPGGDDGGFTGGGQIGYNYQMGSFVLGVETDIQWADTGDNSGVVFIPATGFVGTFVPGRIPQQRARLVRHPARPRRCRDRPGPDLRHRRSRLYRRQHRLGRSAAASNGPCPPTGTCSARRLSPSASKACG